MSAHGVSGLLSPYGCFTRPRMASTGVQVLKTICGSPGASGGRSLGCSFFFFFFFFFFSGGDFFGRWRVVSLRFDWALLRRRARAGPLSARPLARGVGAPP